MGHRRWNGGQQSSGSAYPIACCSLHTWKSLRYSQSSTAKIEPMGSLPLPSHKPALSTLTGDHSNCQARNLSSFFPPPISLPFTFSQPPRLIESIFQKFSKRCPCSLPWFSPSLSHLFTITIAYQLSLRSHHPNSFHSQRGLS